MRYLTSLLLVGGLSVGLTGCSTPRLGLAKKDTPPVKTPERVKYGNPWSRKPKEEVAATKTPEELKQQISEELAASRDKPKKPSPAVAEMLKRGAASEESGDLEGARAAYLDVVALYPQHAEAHHRLGVIADMAQDPQTADEHYAQAYAVNPRDPDLLSDMGYSLYLRGRLNESETKLKDALRYDENHRSAANNLALVHAKQGNYDGTLAMLRLTGTEAEAQQGIARLFPQGRPGAGPQYAMNSPAPRSSPGNPGNAAPPFPPEMEPTVTMTSGVAPWGPPGQTAPQGSAPNFAPGQPPSGQPPMSPSPAMAANPPMNANPWGASPSQNSSTNSAPGGTGPLAQQPPMAPASPANDWAAPPWPMPTTNTAPPMTPAPSLAAKPDTAPSFWEGALGNPANPPAMSPPHGSSPSMSGGLAWGQSPMAPPPTNSIPGMPWSNNAASPPAMGSDWGTGSGHAIEQAGHREPSPFGPAPSAGQPLDGPRAAAMLGLQMGPGSMFPSGPARGPAPSTTNPAPYGAPPPAGNAGGYSSQVPQGSTNSSAWGASSSSWGSATSPAWGQTSPWEVPLGNSGSGQGVVQAGGPAWPGPAPKEVQFTDGQRNYRGYEANMTTIPGGSLSAGSVPPSPWNDVAGAATWGDAPVMQAPTPSGPAGYGSMPQHQGLPPEWPREGVSAPGPRPMATNDLPIVTPGRSATAPANGRPAGNTADPNVISNWPYAPGRPQ